MLVSVATGIQAFSVLPATSHNTHRPSTIILRKTETHFDQGFTADSGLTVDNIPLFIDNLSVENFEESLEVAEVLLKNECVGDVCDDYVSQFQEKAESLGKTLPKGFGSMHH